ncbi:MAG: cobyrinate a,c-diamide synthase [Thermodesulfobacteriota bacterium]
MLLQRPRITISALKGGAGKTILSLGITSAWRVKGQGVAVFKKGPDFIDSGWHAFAAGIPCYNLDPFLMTDLEIRRSFMTHSGGASISVIEGNRGLFDGADLEGCCSTAALARMLHSPVVIVVDVTMATRTVAALVMGCQRFDPELRVAAVILNRVAGSRQESLVRAAVERYCGLPVVGSVPKLKGNVFPERHMGLVPHLETAFAERAVQWTRDMAQQYLDIEALWKIAHEASPLEEDSGETAPRIPRGHEGFSPRIGVIRDSSFWFYYPENIEQLRTLGATVVEISSMGDKSLPELDALYIGGGFPEMQAGALADNVGFRESLRRRIEEGLPVYAECGGLMYLGETLVLGERRYPMVGAVPYDFVLEEKPQGHGYTVLEATEPNPYFPVGEVLRGHEFHYSRAVVRGSGPIHTAFKVLRGHGLDGGRDGLCRKNLLATYTHLHAGGNSLWGRSLLQAAIAFARQKARGFSGGSEKKD